MKLKICDIIAKKNNLVFFNKEVLNSKHLDVLIYIILLLNVYKVKNLQIRIMSIDVNKLSFKKDIMNRLSYCVLPSCFSVINFDYIYFNGYVSNFYIDRTKNVSVKNFFYCMINIFIQVGFFNYCSKLLMIFISLYKYNIFI